MAKTSKIEEKKIEEPESEPDSESDDSVTVPKLEKTKEKKPYVMTEARLAAFAKAKTTRAENIMRRTALKLKEREEIDTLRNNKLKKKEEKARLKQEEIMRLEDTSSEEEEVVIKKKKKAKKIVYESDDEEDDRKNIIIVNKIDRLEKKPEIIAPKPVRKIAMFL
jgi:hypothetical protein